MTIGKNTFVHPTAVISDNVSIGDNCYIGPLCIIGYPAEWRGKEEQDAGVIIGSGTRVTGLVTIDSGVTKPTKIGDDCYLMKHCHVGHDAHVWSNVTLSCGVKIGGHCHILPHSNIGLNAVVHQKVQIAEGCMIGMGAVVTKTTNTQRGRKYAGNPAKDIGENIIK